MANGDPRPGTESIPWRDPYGWHAQRDEVMRVDINDYSRNYKVSTVVVDGSLTYPAITYNVTTVRIGAGQHVAFIEWIDEMGKPNRVRMPAEVVDRILSHRTALNKENRSRKGREAYRG